MRRRSRGVLWMAISLVVGAIAQAHAGRTERVSLGPGGVELAFGTTTGGISADGRLIAFVADEQLMLRDRVTRITDAVHTFPSCTSQIGGPYFSRNGRFVTVAHCLGSMIVHDRTTGITTTHGIGGERPVISD